MVDEAKGISAYLSQNGVMKAKLTSPLMRQIDVDTFAIEFLKKLHCDFYDSSKKIETTLDCNYGKYYQNLGRIYLRDSVLIINIKGDTLKSFDLWWDQNKQLFYTDTFCTYHSIGKKIYGGKGLQAKQDLSTIIFKYPTGTVAIPENSTY